MTKTRTDMEISDVLSSIRRLVSEDRTVTQRPAGPSSIANDNSDRAPSTAALQPATNDSSDDSNDATVHSDVAADNSSDDGLDEKIGSRLASSNRFVLTAALRIENEPDDTNITADDATEAAHSGSESLFSHVPRTTENDADSGPEEGDSAVQPTAKVEDGKNSVADPDKVGSTTLEQTIAELEAAVAGIQADFEPDLGDAEMEEEVEAKQIWPSDLAKDRPMSEFRGIIANFDNMSYAEERLDMSITGEESLPPKRTHSRFNFVVDDGVRIEQPGNLHLSGEAEAKLNNETAEVSEVTEDSAELTLTVTEDEEAFAEEPVAEEPVVDAAMVEETQSDEPSGEDAEVEVLPAEDGEVDAESVAAADRDDDQVASAVADEPEEPHGAADKARPTPFIVRSVPVTADALSEP
ncbi:MAG: hypothetical protein WBA91_14550, partial [Paracoccaceae bacterium]